jgi:hypothetical protein
MKDLISVLLKGEMFSKIIDLRLTLGLLDMGAYTGIKSVNCVIETYFSKRL